MSQPALKQIFYLQPACYHSPPQKNHPGQLFPPSYVPWILFHGPLYIFPPRYPPICSALAAFLSSLLASERGPYASVSRPHCRASLSEAGHNPATKDTGRKRHEEGNSEHAPSTPPPPPLKPQCFTHGGFISRNLCILHLRPWPRRDERERDAAQNASKAKEINTLMMDFFYILHRISEERRSQSCTSNLTKWLLGMQIDMRGGWRLGIGC